MIEKSSGSLATSVLGRGFQGYGDVTPFMWPSYKRTTTAEGGDGVASFSFEEDDNTLLYFLEEGLGQHFTESYNNLGQEETAFMGRVYEVRVNFPTVFYAVSLGNVANRIACYYTSVITNQTQLTQYYEDSASIKRWGTRMLEIRPSVLLNQADAEDLAQDTLARLKEPQIYRGQIRSSGRGKSRGRCQVTIQGYAATADDLRYEEISEGDDTIENQLNYLFDTYLDAEGFITRDWIAPMDAVVPIQSDPVPILRYIRGLVSGRRDSNGDIFSFGCFGGRRFSLRPYPSDLSYRIHTRRDQIAYIANGEEVPHPLVRPGGYSFDAGTFGGRPYEGLEDFRVQRDLQVEYSASGAVLRGPQWSLEEVTKGLAMTILSESQAAL